MNKRYLPAFLLLVLISCSQKKENAIKIPDNRKANNLYNSVINSRLNDETDTLSLSDILSDQNTGFGFYQLDTMNIDSLSLSGINLYLKVLHMDSNSTKNEMFYNYNRDSRMLTFYLYDNILSYTNDFKNNKQINYSDVDKIVYEYYLSDSIHLKHPVYKRNKGIEIKYHVSARSDRLNDLLYEIGLSYIQVINRYCALHFDKNIIEFNKSEISSLHDSLHFNTLISVFHSHNELFNPIQ